MGLQQSGTDATGFSGLLRQVLISLCSQLATDCLLCTGGRPLVRRWLLPTVLPLSLGLALAQRDRVLGPWGLLIATCCWGLVVRIPSLQPRGLVASLFMLLRCR